MAHQVPCFRSCAWSIFMAPCLIEPSVIALWLISYRFKAYILLESRVLADGARFVAGSCAVDLAFLAVPGTTRG